MSESGPSTLPLVANICSPSFSGSTLLDLMLGSGAKAFSCGEIGFWYRHVYLRQSPLSCSCGQPNCPAWQGLLTPAARDFHEHALRQLDLNLLTDGTKRLSWVLDVNRWSQRQAFRVANLTIWKTPEAYAYSYWKRERQLLEGMDRYYRYYQRLQGLGLPVIAVNYHRLVVDPSGHLQRLCELLQTPYSDGQEYFWERTHHLAYGNDNTRRTLKDPSATIVDRQEFPDEFWNDYRNILPRFPAEKYQELFTWLNERDVMQVAGLNSSPWDPPRICPLWYYKQVVPSHLRRLLRWYR